MKNSRKQHLSTVNSAEIAHFAKDSAAWWDKDGPFAPLHRMTPARMTFIKAAIETATGGPVKGKTILDIGCGGGLVSIPLARLGGKVTAIDADRQAITTASAHATAEGTDVTFINGAAEDLVAQKKKFDVVMALEVIEHVDHPDSFIAMCTDLVKPDGIVIFSTLNRTWKSYAMGIIAAERLLGWVPVGTHDWKKFVKPSELARMAEDSGLFLRNAKGMIYNPLTAEFSIHPHDLDVNYFLVASPARNR